MGNWNSSDFSDEDMDQDVQQDIAAAAAQSVGIDMGGYDFGGYDPSGTDFTGVSNRSAASAIANSFMADPNSAARTAMAIRQSYPVYSGSMRPALDAFINRYTAARGPLTRSAFNRAYDITKTNLGGINTLGYDTAKALQRIGIGSGQVKSADPTAGRLRGTVFKDGVISKGGVNQGVSADKYYGGPAPMNAEGTREYNTYFDKYGYADPANRALNRAYDQYMNPYNEPGKVGYNPDAPIMNPVTDQVRPGLRSGIFTDMSGRPTVQGPLRTMDTAYSAQDRAVMSLAGLTLGGLMQQLTGKKTVIGNVPSMDAMLPTPEMMEQGQTYGGLSRQIGAGIGDVVQGIQSYFSPEPQNRPPAPQYTEAQLNENMYGVGMPDLGVSSYGAPVPEANIQLNRSAGPITTEDVVRDIDTVLDKLNTGALGEIGKQSNRGTLRPEDINAQDLRTTAGAALADANFDGTYDRSFFNDVLGIMGLRETPTFDFQPQILQRTPSGEFIEIQPRERKEIQGPQSSRSLPNVMTLADAERNTYRSGYQGQPGLYSAGGKGQTYYGGGNQQNKNFLGTAAERARQAFDNLYGYFTG
ncbi:MAG: hypothetical protein ACO3I1_07130 [Burkholderiales bacterium]